MNRFVTLLLIMLWSTQVSATESALMSDEEYARMGACSFELDPVTAVEFAEFRMTSARTSAFMLAMYDKCGPRDRADEVAVSAVPLAKAVNKYRVSRTMMPVYGPVR